MEYQRIFEPLRLSPKLDLPNRLVMAPMTTTAGESDGAFSEQEIAYLAARAAGGVGTIMTPACYVHKSGHAFPGQVGAHSDSMLPSLSRCAKAIRDAGGRAVLQIHHGGNATKGEFTGGPPWAPSAVHNRRGSSELPVAMTAGQIHEVIGAFAAAARRARDAGFDGIEIHGANTYLLQQFFSPYTNRRDDEWGAQNLDHRCRFAFEVVRAVRREVGPDYTVFYRLSPEEPDPDGYSVEDAIELLRRIVPLGIDAVHVSTWAYGQALRYEASGDCHTTLQIKQALNVPVIGVGMIRTPEQALRVLDDGVDLVALGRELLFEPRWADKVRSGGPTDLRTKISSIEEIDTLEVPDRMKIYLRRFYPDNL
jgi:2,4-dienoyl-CoA reductase-like NADH-dependent reductase (Old Yellow Enzyme family)